MKYAKSLLSIAYIFSLNFAQAEADTWTPFSVVEVTTDQWLIRNGPDEIAVELYERAIADNFAEVGDPFGLYAKARADFGVNGSYTSANNQPFNDGAFAESSWSDAFTVLGGSGTGTLDIAVRVNGHFSGSETNVHYLLFVGSTPITRGSEGGAGLLGVFDSGKLNSPPDGSTSLISGYGISPVTLARLRPDEPDELSLIQLIQENPLHNGSNIYFAQLPFVYGVPVYIASYLGVESLGDGVADFYGSAYFGISAPNGATIATASNTLYSQSAAVVPIPSAFWLFGAGICGLLSSKYRRK